MSVSSVPASNDAPGSRTGASAQGGSGGRAGARPRRRASWKAKLLLVLFTLAICGVVLEIGVRLLWSGQWTMPRESMRDASVFRYQFKPNLDTRIPIADLGTFSVKTNTRGFRGSTVAEIADKDLRVVSIGDSFAFGWGIEAEAHGVTRTINDFAKAHPDRSVGLANIAMGGWGPDDYLYAYTTEVQPHKVDVVIIGVFPGNDILPADYPRVTSVQPHQPLSGPSGFVQWIKPKSIDFLRTQISGNMLFSRLAIRMGRVPESFRRFNPDMDAQQRDWATSMFYLDELINRAQADGVQVVLMCYSSSIVVSSATTIDGVGLDHTTPERVLGGYSEKRGVPFIRMTAELTAANAGNDLFFPLDRHLTAKGHEVVKQVLDRDLVPVLKRVLDKKSK